MQESVRQGKSFAAPLAKAGVFPPMVSQMVSVGEESGTLAEMLASIADFYEAEVETATEQLTSTIEPILIVDPRRRHRRHGARALHADLQPLRRSSNAERRHVATDPRLPRTRGGMPVRPADGAAASER